MPRPTSLNRCPICADFGQVAFQIADYTIAHCEACRHRFLDRDLSADHTQSHYQDDYFSGGGAGYVDYLAQENLITSYGHRFGKILNNYDSPGTALDVGSAAGFFMKGLHDQGWEVAGVEPNATMAKQAKERFGFSSFTGCLEDWDGQQAFDLISMVQVVAHFRDLRKALWKASQVTQPRGLWLIETWDFRSLPAKLFGRAWHEYSPPTVVNWFSRNSLEKLAKQFGMELIATGKPRKDVTARHAVSLASHTFSKFGLTFPLKSASSWIPKSIVFPYPAFDVFWMLFRRRPSEPDNNAANIEE